MLATDVLVFIAFCLAVIAAVGVRIALSLKDIGTAIDRATEAFRETGRAALPFAPERPGSPLAPGQEEGGGQPSESEIAAVIGIAARYAAQSKREGTRD